MMPTKHLAAVLLLLVFHLESNVLQLDAKPSANVEVVAITLLGESIDWQETSILDLTQRWSGKSFRANFKGFRGSNIPYGDYTLRLAVRGFREYEQILRVYQPQVSLRVGLSVSRIVDTPIPVAKGIIKPVPQNAASHWVKLLPIVNNSSLMDSQVQADGSFRLAGFDPGAYLLVVIRGTEVVYSKQVSLHGGENNIDVLIR